LSALDKTIAAIVEELLFAMQVVVETEATPVKWREGVYDITAKKGQYLRHAQI
jgi:hypothetical protein